MIELYGMFETVGGSRYEWNFDAVGEDPYVVFGGASAQGYALAAYGRRIMFDGAA